MTSTSSVVLRLRRACVFFGAFWVFTADNVRAATYYVSTTSDDTSGIGTLANPWRTIQKAASIAVAGDTVSRTSNFYFDAVDVY